VLDLRIFGLFMDEGGFLLLAQLVQLGLFHFGNVLGFFLLLQVLPQVLFSSQVRVILGLGYSV